MNRTMTIPAALDGVRIDIALPQMLPELSRRAVRRLIDDGAVSINGKRVRVASRPLETGSTISVFVAARAAQNFAFQIVGETDAYIAVDKPVGMPTEPTPQGSANTLAFELKKQLRERGDDVSELFAIHRLDAHTSGVVVFARTKDAARVAAAQLQAQSVKRRYVALVAHLTDFESTCFDAALTKRPNDQGRIMAYTDVNPDDAAWAQLGLVAARSLAVTLARGDDASLLWLAPQTGRMHQLRVHLAEAGHPLVGEKRYATPRPTPHPGLHAWSIALEDPAGVVQTFFAPPPSVFVDAALQAGVAPAAIEPLALAPQGALA